MAQRSIGVERARESQRWIQTEGHDYCALDAKEEDVVMREMQRMSERWLRCFWSCRRKKGFKAAAER